ncbi:hypothetical protein ElyMa_006265200 [Elysia marginata]|uniref:Uncharacterized protein n=1 Tax=Elysia marginata TaxID=1093978 RepID=A0AAV4HC40_9GAST|nr:hypothetical protein ElyMa_006265200 [Elysia marginata]
MTLFFGPGRGITGRGSQALCSNSNISQAGHPIEPSNYRSDRVAVSLNGRTVLGSHHRQNRTVTTLAISGSNDHSMPMSGLSTKQRLNGGQVLVDQTRLMGPGNK